MIYYFSATGNSAWVARQIAVATGDRACSIITDAGDLAAPEPIAADETLGLVFPVHAWSAPGLFLEFIDRLSVDPAAFVFAVCTYGDSPGAALRWLAKSIRLDSGYGIAMPNSYIPLFNVDEPELAARKIARAKEALPAICAQISRREPVFPDRDKAPDRWLTRFIPPLFKLISKDKKFRVDDSCVSCGRCVGLPDAQHSSGSNKTGLERELCSLYGVHPSLPGRSDPIRKPNPSARAVCLFR